jgi:hypothetical protein
MRHPLIALAATLLCGCGFEPPAFAQGSIIQSGAVTAFHTATWFQNGVVADGGSPATPYLSSIGLFGGSSCPFGISSQTGPGPSLTAGGLFTICQTPTATTFTIAGVNGGSTPSVFFNVGGALLQLPSVGPIGNVTGPGSSVSGDLACFSGTSGVLISDCGSGYPISLTSGVTGILPVANGGMGAATFTANAPLLGNGASAVTSGSRSGNTTTFATATGTLTNGDCVNIDASGNFRDAGGPCTTGGGGGTVTSGTANQLTYYSSSGTTVVGLATANNGILITSGAGAPSIGTALPNGVTATTQSANDNTTKVATTAYVATATSPLAPLASPALTGSPTINGTAVVITTDSRFTSIPQNSQSAGYTLVIGDAGKEIYHPSSDTTARTWTIPANASVAFGIGTKEEFVNDCSAGIVTLAITSDTLEWFPTGTTGSRSIAACGIATATKVTATKWVLTGTGIS